MNFFIYPKLNFLPLLVLTFDQVRLVSKTFWINGKQCWPWISPESDAAFYDVKSGSTPIAQVCLSQYLG